MLISGALAAAAILSHPGYVPAKLYRFQAGDSLARIAKLNETGYERLMTANPGLKPTSIRSGEVVAIPARIRGLKEGETYAPKNLVASLSKTSAKLSTSSYKVRNGDNDWSIAPKFGITPKQLRALNPGTDWNHIRPGQVVSVPAQEDKPVVVAAVEPTPKPIPGTKRITVQSGDNDWVIASRYGMKPSELRALNPGVYWRNLKPGHVLKVSASSKVEREEPAAPESATRVASATPSAKVPVIRTTRVAVSRENVRVRAGGKTSSSVRSTVARGEVATVLDRVGDWYKLDFSNGGTGWVRGDMLKPVRASEVIRSRKVAAKNTEAPKRVASRSEVEGKRVYIGKEDVNLRSAASGGSVRARLAKNTSGRVVAKNGSWIKLSFSDGRTGWVRGDMLRSTPVGAKRPALVAKAEPKKQIQQFARASSSGRPRAPQVEHKAVVAAVSPRSGVRHRSIIKEEEPTRMVASGSPSSRGLLSAAASWVGTRYRYGGTSRSGIDCSAFTGAVYRSQGISLPRTSIAQSKTGSSVSRGDLKEGDLVFFRTRGNRVSHVGMYIGNGKFVHASSGSGRVRTSSLSEGYYSHRYAGARRVGNAPKGEFVASRSGSRSGSRRSKTLPEVPTRAKKDVAVAAKEDKAAMKEAEKALVSEPRSDRIKPGTDVVGQ